jgi:DNA-binding MarR family transcriptional regulator
MPLFISNQKPATPVERIFAFFRMVREQIFCAKPPYASAFLDIAILHLAAEGGSPAMKDIADMLRIAGPSATIIIDRLVDKGELVRIEDKDDRRVVRLTITAAGRKTLKTGTRESESGMDHLLSVLDDKERAVFDKLITKIISQ